MKLKLLSILCLTMSGDSMIIVSLIWLIISKGDNAVFLGIFLFLNTLIPYIGQHFFTNKFNSTLNPLLEFGKIRLIGVFLSLFLCLLYSVWPRSGTLYLSAGGFTIINFLSNQYLEAHFGKLVADKILNANLAARIQQTAIQLSVLLGASISGFILTHGGFQAVLVANSLTYAFGYLSINKLISFKNFDGLLGKSKNYKSDAIDRGENLPYQLMMFIILAITLYSFNFLLPFFIQQDKQWSPIIFGLVDAFAATGAFFSVIVINDSGFGKIFHKMSYGFIGLSLAGFYLVKIPVQAIILGFIFGFSMNCLRIKIREFIYRKINNIEKALTVGKHLTFINMTARALMPLFLSFVVINTSSSYIFLVLGSALFFVLFLGLVLSFIFNKYPYISTILSEKK